MGIHQDDQKSFIGELVIGVGKGLIRAAQGFMDRDTDTVDVSIGKKDPELFADHLHRGLPKLDLVRPDDDEPTKGRFNFQEEF